MEITRSVVGLEVTQKKYALNILEDTGFLSCKPVATPMETNAKFYHRDSEFLLDNTSYRSIVGKSLYLTITRPNLNFAIQQLSQYLDKPTVLQWKAIHRLLRYIKSAPGQGILFSSQNDWLLTSLF